MRAINEFSTSVIGPVNAISACSGLRSKVRITVVMHKGRKPTLLLSGESALNVSYVCSTGCHQAQFIS